MTDPTLLPDSDLVPDTTDPEPDESPKTDPVPDDAPEGATVPAVVIEADTVIVNETAGAGEDDLSTHGHTDTEDPTP